MPTTARDEPGEEEDPVSVLMQALYPRLVLWCAARMSCELQAHTDPVCLARDLQARLRENLSQFTGRDAAAFNAWVFRMAEDAVLDAEAFCPPGRHPEPDAPHAPDLERVKRAVGTLRADHQDVLRLRRFEELPLGAVAERMGCTPMDAGVLYTEALKSLRSAIAPA